MKSIISSLNKLVIWVLLISFSTFITFALYAFVPLFEGDDQFISFETSNGSRVAAKVMNMEKGQIVVLLSDYSRRKLSESELINAKASATSLAYFKTFADTVEKEGKGLHSIKDLKALIDKEMEKNNIRDNAVREEIVNGFLENLIYEQSKGKNKFVSFLDSDDTRSPAIIVEAGMHKNGTRYVILKKQNNETFKIDSNDPKFTSIRRSESSKILFSAAVVVPSADKDKNCKKKSSQPQEVVDKILDFSSPVMSIVVPAVRSIMMKSNIKYQDSSQFDTTKTNFIHRKENGEANAYKILSAGINNFSQPIVSIGAGAIDSKREYTLMDAKNSEILAEKYALLKDKLDRKLSKSRLIGKNFLSASEVFEIAINHMRSIFNNDNEAIVDRFISKWSKQKMHLKNKNDYFARDKLGNLNAPLIPIDDFVKAGIGICRHHAMVLAYFLNQLSKEGKYLPTEGRVYHIREDVIGGGHAWTAFKDPNTKSFWHIDSLWNVVGDYSKKKDREKLSKMGYGDSAIKRQVKRLNVVDKS